MKICYAALILLSTFTAYSQQPPLKLWYNSPAEHFEEALVLGNGRIGATVFGGVKQEKIYLNDITLWSGEPVNPNMNPKAYTYLPEVRAALAQENYPLADSLVRHIQGKFSESYSPLGTLLIDFEKGSSKNYYRELSLDNAIANIIYGENGAKISIEYLISNPDKIFAIKFKAEKKQSLSFKIGFESQLKYAVKSDGNELVAQGRAPFKVDTANKNRGDNLVIFEDKKGARFSVVLKIVDTDGKVTATNSSLNLKNASTATLLVSIATSFNGFDKNPETEGLNDLKIAHGQINALKTKNFNALKTAHVADYKRFYDRVKLDLGQSKDNLPTNERLRKYTDENTKDPYLEVLYFQYGRYLLISSSRTLGVPANLQGLWNPFILPPWRSNYTLNINAEENYWPAENTNLSEMHLPFLSFLGNLQKTGEVTAKTFYNAKGWTCGHNSDIWAMTNPVGNFGKGSPSWANWAMGGTWASTHLYEHYLFNGDKNWLKNYAYPIMKGASEFCLDMLVEAPDGTLVTSPATSPENIYVTDKGFKGATLYGGTADLAMIKELFNDLVRTSDIIGGDEAFKNKIISTLAKLRPYKIGKKGNLQEWYYDWEDEEPKHRHQSHLYGLFPGRQITVKETPELAEACKKTLEIKGDETTGWSKGWRINLWARLQDGNHAYKMYRELLHYVEPDGIRTNYSKGGGTYPNLFDAHPPFQIDGNFGGTAAVAEMLVQSDEANVYILPALPDAWTTGSVKGLKARGGFELDISWANGELQNVKIKSINGGTTQLNYKGKIKLVRLAKEASVSFKTI